jgi:GR25 family glycosyltransferase involved in LPS biosynthesis
MRKYKYLNNTNNTIYIYIIFIIILLFILGLLLFNYYKSREYFDNNLNNEIKEDDIDIYVISLRHENRLKNINEQQKKIIRNIEIFDAVKGDNLNLENLIEQKVISPAWLNRNDDYKKREVGCYMSHYNLYNKIKNDKKSKYTIVFEDDFYIIESNFYERVLQIVNTLNKQNIDFDILYLGNIYNNHGDHVIDNIYKVDYSNQIVGTHAMLFNNKNIDTVIDNLTFSDIPIDLKLSNKSEINDIKILVVYPVMANQGGAETSDIRNMEIETYISTNY